MPALTSPGTSEFQAHNGGRLELAGSQPIEYSATGLYWANSTYPFYAAGASAVIDAPAVRSISDAFDDGSIGASTHFVTATAGGTVRFPSLTSVKTPLRAEDSLTFDADAGAIDAPSLRQVSGVGRVTFSSSNTGSLALGDLAVASPMTMAVWGASAIRAGGIRDASSAPVSSSISLGTSDVIFEIAGNLELGDDIALTATEPNTLLTIGRNFTHRLTDEIRLGLDTAIVAFDGTAPQALEAGGTDRGAARPVAANFGLGQVVVGTVAQATTVVVQDLLDSGHRGGGSEALYLLGLEPATNEHPEGLRVAPGSTVVIGCLPVYVFADANAATGQRMQDLFPAGVHRIPYDRGFLELGTDIDSDGLPDCRDNCPRVANADQLDGDGNGIGDACEVLVPLTDPDVSQRIEGLGLHSETGFAVSRGGDVNHDGSADFLVGAPGYTPGGSSQKGAAMLFLGSTVGTDRAAPDVIFVGASPHERAGVAVAGGVDLNCDGTQDIVIGAEQVDRTVDPAVPSGNGRVYVIFFDPSDATHYPRLNDGNPATVDVVDLALVGQPGGIPGIVYTGAALGDRAGAAVAVGSLTEGAGANEVLIGAPGGDPGGLADAGSTYLVFGDCARSGLLGLARVANGLADELPGVLFNGRAAGDRLGQAVALPGDLLGTPDPDVVMGAPVPRRRSSTAGPRTRSRVEP